MDGVGIAYVQPCPRCWNPNPLLVEDQKAADLICSECGFVFNERILDCRPERRTMTTDGVGEKNKSRTSDFNFLLMNGGLTTAVSSKGGDPSKCKALKRMHRIGTTNELNKRLMKAYGEIDDIASRMELLQKIKLRAKYIFKRASNNDIGITSSRKGTFAYAAVSLFLACKIENSPRSLKEILAATGIKKKVLTTAYKHVARLLQSSISTHKPLQSSTLYVRRFCSALGMDETTIRLVEITVVQAAGLRGIQGKAPVSITAACILLVARRESINTSGADIAKVTNIAASTIISTCNAIELKQADNVTNEQCHSTTTAIANAAVIAQLHKVVKVS